LQLIAIEKSLRIDQQKDKRDLKAAGH